MRSSNLPAHSAHHTGFTNSETQYIYNKFRRRRHRDLIQEKQERVREMAAAVVEILGEYGFVVLALLLYVFLNLWMGFQVGKARKKYKVFYPNLYAVESENKDAKLFNCVQRGHQNSLEFMPVFFATLLIGGVQHPIIAAGLGVLYTVFRFFYFKGYSTGVPENRLNIGGFHFLSLLGLMICTASFGINLLIQGVL